MRMNDKREMICACGADMRRDLHSELSNANGTEKGETFWSQSLAISPNQIEEHRRLFPNVKVRADGCIGFDSVREREKYCEATGFHKQPGKPRRVGRKL